MKPWIIHIKDVTYTDGEGWCVSWEFVQADGTRVSGIAKYDSLPYKTRGEVEEELRSMYVPRAFPGRVFDLLAKE